MNWQLQEAKARFSNVVKQAIEEGPQHVTVRGEPAVVVLAKKDYDKLIHPKPPFIEFMRQSPLFGLSIKCIRDKSLNRDVDL